MLSIQFFALGEEVANIVNEALRKNDISTDENMYFGIIANHFDQLGCLEEDVKQKWIKGKEHLIKSNY